MRFLLRSRHRRGQSGAVAAEFAIVMPFVIILLGGTIFLTMAFYQWTMLYAGARAGAEYARVHLYNPKGAINSADIQSAARVAVPFGTPDVAVNGPVCYCADNTTSVSCTGPGTCAVGPGNADTRVLKYVQIVVSEPVWGIGHGGLPPLGVGTNGHWTIQGYATVRYQ